MESDTFPENFPDVGSWEFKRVWAERREFCKFSLDWSNPTGIFEKFQKFCKQKIKNHVSSTASKIENASRDKSAA